MKRIVFNLTILTLILIGRQVAGQAPDYLEQYIVIGLDQNLLVQQQKMQVDKSFQDIRATRGALLPSIDVNARYTRASGGRVFQMPLGDLMNPVYNTLNSLVGEGTFPNIQNQELNFNRTTDVDTRISLLQPIYDHRLIMQNKIQHGVATMVEEDLSITKRDIVFDIKKSYYTYLKALRLRKLLNQTRELVEENLRVSEVLFANDKVTEDAVWRSKTEVRQVDFQIAEAEKQYQMAKRYFNQLLNRDLLDSIYVDQFSDQLLEQDFEYATNFVRREELEKVLIAKNVAEQQSRLATSNNLPNFYLALDAGYQGTDYSFDSESDYFLASAVMSWNLFSGFKNSAQKQKAKIEQRRLETQYIHIKNGLELEMEDARLEFEKSTKNYATTVAAEQESTSNYRIVSRKYEEGLANQVELIDARTFMTNAASESIIAKYDVLISRAAYERATAGYVINVNNQ